MRCIQDLRTAYSSRSASQYVLHLFTVDSASFDIAAVFYLRMFAGLRKNEILNDRWNWFHPLEGLTENGGGRHELPDIDWDDGNAVEGRCTMASPL